MNLFDGIKSKVFSPPPAPKSAPPKPAAPAPAPAATPAPSTSSFKPAAVRPAPVCIAPCAPPPTTLRTERIGDGQANCLERAFQCSKPGDTIALCSDRTDGSGHAVVQHADGSVTDPNQPSITYPDLGSWQATHPQYVVEARVSQRDLKDVLSLPPGPARDAEIKKLGLGSAANVAVADCGEGEDPELRVMNNGLNLRASPDGNAAALLDAPMPPWTTVEVLECGTGDAEGWARVRYLDGDGVSHEGWAKIDGQNPDGSPYTSEVSAGDAAELQEANGLYINQFFADDDVVDSDRANANCGPTSLAVAFEAQGLELPEVNGLLNDGSEGDRIYRARYAMYGDYPTADNTIAQPSATMDGVTATATEGEVTYATGDEASTYTDLAHMERAVNAAGGSATRIDADTDAIATELDAGRTVIVTGTFIDPDSDTGARKEGLWSVDSSVGDHIVAITGTTSDGNFIVCDPANPDQAPVVVTPDQLESFMNGNETRPLSVGGPDDAANG